MHGNHARNGFLPTQRKLRRFDALYTYPGRNIDLCAVEFDSLDVGPLQVQRERGDSFDAQVTKLGAWSTQRNLNRRGKGLGENHVGLRENGDNGHRERLLRVLRPVNDCVQHDCDANRHGFEAEVLEKPA